MTTNWFQYVRCQPGYMSTKLAMFIGSDIVKCEGNDTEQKRIHGKSTEHSWPGAHKMEPTIQELELSTISKPMEVS